MGMRAAAHFRGYAVLRPILAALLVFCAFAAAGIAQTAADPSDPSALHPTGFVNDYAGVIDPASKAALERKLTDLKNSTNPQVEIAVAVVRTTGGRDIFTFSRDLARTWKIGSKADDNPSALLFVAIDDRKYFTQISRDLEDELPDGLVGSIQRQYLVPEFKKGNYSKGISDTIDAYIARIRDKGNTSGPATPQTDNTPKSSAVSWFLCCGLAILGVIFLIALYYGNKGGGGRGGGRGGGSGGGDSVVPWVVGGIIGNVLDAGSSSSSDWGGSSGSDGGWGGFGGGGDFGGGGAGGDW